MGQADKEIARALRKHDHMAFVNPALRKDIDGYYYFGSFYKKDTSKYYLVGFKWVTTTDTKEVKTKGLLFFIDKDTKERKAKSVLCDSAVEEKIYNLNFVSEDIALSEDSIGISDRLMEAKRLLEKKEITKEEFDAKLNSILH